MSNKLYDTAQKLKAVYTDPTKENEILELNSLLNDEVSNLFENNQSEIIESTLTQIINENDGELLDIVLDEVNFEIENVLYEDDTDNKDYDSTMVLVPCVILSQAEAIYIPSIQSFEDHIRQALLSQNLIQSKEQFNLGTIRLSQGALDEFTIQDWWQTHRDLINERFLSDEEKSENKLLRYAKTAYDMEEPVTIIYFVGQILCEENNNKTTLKIFDSQIDTDFWAGIGHQFSDEYTKYNILPSLPINESLENIQAILEMISFELFFEDNAYDEDIELLYAPIENSDEYVILFFDGESHTLEKFYIYNTEGENDLFICNLVEQCLKKPTRTLYSYEKSITIDTLNMWKEDANVIDLSSILKESNQIDLFQAYQFCNLTDKDTDIIKPTIH